MNKKIFFIFPALILLTLSAHASLADLDKKLFDKVYNSHTPLGDIYFKTTNYFGDGHLDYAVSLLYFTFGNKADHDFAKINTISLITTGTIVQSIKLLTHRRRPTYERYDSFPSGHTAYAFAMATLFSDRYPKLKIPFFVLAASTGIARIYLGKHYPSDVIVGAILGYAIPKLILKHRDTFIKIRW